jgi:TPR repeat protein
VAQNNLGYAYYIGDGVEQDYADGLLPKKWSTF